MLAVPWRVNRFITSGGGSYCDNCIRIALSLSSSQVQQVTSTLETTSDFVRERGKCQICGEMKEKVIRSVKEA